MNNKQDFVLLSNLKIGYLLLATFCHFVIIFASGLLVKWIVEPYHKQLGLAESYYLSLYSSIGNFFLPIGSGLAMRAVYLKKHTNLNYKNFMTTLYGNYIIVFLCNGALGLLALFALREYGDTTPAYHVLLLVFASMATSTGLMVLHILPKNLILLIGKKTGKVGRIFSEVINGWSVVAKQRQLIIKMCLVTVIAFIALMGVNFFAVSALGLTIGFSALVLYSTIGSIALLLNITPGSLGIKEGLYIFSSAVLGFTVPQVLAISIIDRATKFLVLAGGWALVQTSILPGSRDFRRAVAGNKVMSSKK